MQATDAPFQSTLVYNAWLKSMVEQHGKKAHKKTACSTCRGLRSNRLMFGLLRFDCPMISLFMLKSLMFHQ